jgi:hypothetical protein
MKEAVPNILIKAATECQLQLDETVSFSEYVDKAIQIANRMQNSLSTMVQKRNDHTSNNEPEPKKARQAHSTAKVAPMIARAKFLQQLGRRPVAEIASKLERCPKCLQASKSRDDKRCGPHFLEYASSLQGNFP